MNSEQQDECQLASMNAKSLEDLLLTYDDVIGLSKEEAEEIISRCDQIIYCMNECILNGDADG